MSDAPTPRTDKEIVEVYDEMSDSTDFYVKPDFARKLERESDQLAKQCVVFVNEIAELRKDEDEVSVFKKIDEYHLFCSRTYGPYPNDYQSGVLQGLSCARALAVDGEKS